MSEGLLEALSTLYHHPDRQEKKRASLWLEEWRLTSDAWKTADGMLHSATRNVEVLFFCAQTLVFKIQQDFEELPMDEVPQLRDSLVTLLAKFSREDGMAVVRKQLALAIAAFCAHVPSSFWAPTGCVSWMAEHFWRENDVASVVSLMELLVVFPEEARNDRIGLHPKRRTQYRQELEASLPQAMEILEKCRSMASVEQLLSAMGGWLSLCEMCALQGSEAIMNAFVQLATEALENPVTFSAAVDFLSELLYITGNAPFLPEMKEATERVAPALVHRHAPQLVQGTVDEAKKPGLARLFCDLGCFHEDLILTQDEMSSALIGAILAATSDPDEDVHQHVFEFWERLTYRVAHWIKSESLEPQRVDYYRSIFERFMTALVELAKLPEDYLEMSSEERREVNRRDIRVAMADAVDVLGDRRSLQSLISALSNACHQEGTENWREIEALLLAIEAIYVSCRKCQAEMVGPLFQALGAVPDAPIIQAAMCECLATYASWLPDLVEQTGSDPLTMLIPVIFKNMAQAEWAASAVDAFVGLCKHCRRHLAAHATQLLDLHQQVLQAANAFHQWIPVDSSEFIMKESDVLEVMTALIHGMSRTENKEIASQFLWTLSEGILQDLDMALESLQSPTPHLEAKLQIFVARLKTVFKGNTISVISAQLLSRVCPNLLQLADRAANHDVLVEEISTCLRYAVKSAGLSGSETLSTLATALPQLFSATRHCGYLYVASEITKMFGQDPAHAPVLHRMVTDQFSVVCSVFRTPSDFTEHPDLADDAFLMAGRVLNYCPEAMLSHVTLLTETFDTATKGILVQHEDACRSILRFLSHLMENYWHRDTLQEVVAPRGSFVIQVLMTGVVGGLPLRVLDDVSRTLRSILVAAEDTAVGWISQILGKLPNAVISSQEKTTFVENVLSDEVQKSERTFQRLIDDFADICRRSRVVRQAAQSALIPEGYV